MSSVCKSAVGCVVDSRLPLRSSYINLYKWAESDAQFVRSVAAASSAPNNRATFMDPPTHGLVDSYSCRQMYLRSYTFSKKETVPEKTIRCFGKVKEKATDFPFFIYHHRKDGTTEGSFRSFVTCRRSFNNNNNNKKKKEKKGCSVFYSIFRRLLSCTISVDVEEADASGSQFDG